MKYIIVHPFNPRSPMSICHQYIQYIGPYCKNIKYFNYSTTAMNTILLYLLVDLICVNIWLSSLTSYYRPPPPPPTALT